MTDPRDPLDVPPPASLTLSARFDAPVVHPHGERRHLVVELTMQAAPVRAERAPVDMAFVIDASGSMSGGKLEAVKQALLQLVDRIAPADRITLVSFGSDVEVHCLALGMDAVGRERLRHDVMRLCTRGCTNLSGGWQSGVRALVLDPAARRGGEPGRTTRRRAAVLLSDGHANEGVTDPERLTAMALDALADGVATTCVGVGDGYSTTQLVAISDGSGGRFHHASTPDEIVTVLVGELDEVLSVAAEQVTLTLALPEGVTAQSYGAPLRRVPDGVAMTVGSLYGGVARTMVVALDVPAGLPGTEGVVVVTAAGMGTMTGLPFAASSAAAFRWALDPMGAVADDMAAVVVRQWMLWLSAEAARMQEAGAPMRVVVRLLQDTVPRLTAYAAASPTATALVQEKLPQLWALGEQMDARSLKELYVRSHKPMRGERELRW